MPYMRGHVRHPQKDALMAASDAVHGPRLRALAFDAPASWDSWKLGWVPPIRDQSQCGSCWDFSGTRVATVAYIKAGIFPADGSKIFSEQYTLDCGRNGGCGGDDNVTVLDWAKKTGLPLDSDYGPYSARSGRCQVGSKTLYKLDDWGFADGSQGNGITPVDKIKAAIMLYGGVGSAVAAGGSWDGYRPGTVHHGNSRSIDHDVFLSGWQDDSSLSEGGWWWMDNSWGTGWGEGGRMRIAYGADSIGTEAVFGYVKSQDEPIDWSTI